MSSFVLKIIAVTTMLIDHSGYLIFGGFSFMNYIGRLAFPIFAFLITEGYIHTSNIKKYFFRLLVFAIISQLRDTSNKMAFFIVSFSPLSAPWKDQNGSSVHFGKPP